MSNSQKEDIKIEDILKSIKKMIDSHDSDTQKKPLLKDEEDKSVLDLTNIVANDSNSRHENNDSIISGATKKRAEEEFQKFLDNLEDIKRAEEENKPLYSMVTTLMRPLVKLWIDNNLPTLVEKILREEIHNITHKKE